MMYPTGSLNTLILKVGKKNIQVGYAGDFHPATIEASSLPGRLRGGSSDPESLAQIVDEFLKRKQADSALIIVRNTTTGEEKQRISTELSKHEACSSLYFLPKAVCEAFGNGKTSAVVVSCGFSTTEISLVIKGELVETRTSGNGLQQLHEKVSRALEQEMSDGHIPIQGAIQTILEEALSFQDMATHFKSQSLVEELKESVDKYVEECACAVENALLLVKSSNHRKTLGQNCIVIAGRICAFQGFLNAVIECLVTRLGDNVKDMITYNTILPAAFTGASVLGINSQSRMMFAPPGTVRYDTLPELPLKNKKGL